MPGEGCQDEFDRGYDEGYREGSDEEYYKGIEAAISALEEYYKGIKAAISILKEL